MAYLYKAVAFAIAYYVSGKLGSFWAIPPHFATVIWPASGIALAGLLILGSRYWVGILFGAFVVNFNYTASLALQPIVITFIISVGATIQALLGYYLCRKMVNFPSALEEMADVFKIIFYGGILSCLVSATVGTSVLYIAGFVSSYDLVAHWFTWWTGDLLGVIAFTPVIILLFSPRNENIPVSTNRKWIVSLSLLTMFISVTFLYSLAKKYNRHDEQINFDSKVISIANEFEAMLNNYKNVLVANEQFFLASNYVSSEEFGVFTRKLLDLYPGIHALSWNPKVTREQRVNFVESIRHQGYDDFTIFDRVSLGKTQQSPDRDIYFPVAYVYPYEKNKAAHGFDTYGPDAVASDVRKKLLDRAETEEKTITTGRISIVQAENNYGLLVYHPIFKHASKGQDKELAGFTAGVFIVPEMLSIIQQHASSLGANVVLYDKTGGESQFLYDSRVPEGREVSQDLSLFKGIKYNRSIEFAERQLDITFIETSESYKQYNWVLWAVVAGGLLYTGLFGVFIFSVTARADVTQKIVDRKTLELREANAELEEFAYRTSHDLRSPLVSSIGLLSYIKGTLPTDNERLTKSVDLVQGSLQKLELLIVDILELTKTKNMTETLQLVDTAAFVDEAIEKFSHMDNFERVNLVKQLEYDEPIHVQQGKLVLVIENLISNAIKYQDINKDHSYIHISTYQKDQNFVFEVADNGIGIPKHKQHELFGMFHRFHPKVSFGSGLGLYMIKKSVDALNGNIEFEDTGEGSLFRVLIPINNT